MLLLSFILVKTLLDCGVVSPFLHLGQVQTSRLLDSGIVASFFPACAGLLRCFFRPLFVCSGCWGSNLRRSLWESFCLFLVSPSAGGVGVF